MKIEEKTLLKVVNSLGMTKQVEIGCEDCFNEVDQFVEMLRSGGEPDKIMPLVQDHLNTCACCKEELEALISALEAANQE